MSANPKQRFTDPSEDPRRVRQLPSERGSRGRLTGVILGSVLIHGLAFGLLSNLKKPLPPAPPREVAIPLPPPQPKSEYQVRLAPQPTPEPERLPEPPAPARMVPEPSRPREVSRPRVAQASRPASPARPTPVERQAPVASSAPVLDLTQATAGVDARLTSGRGPGGFTLGTTAMGDPAGPPGANGGARPGRRVEAPDARTPPAQARPAPRPVPVAVKRMPEPLTVPKASYPSDAKRKRVEGTVRLLVTVDAGGRVVSVRVLSGLGHGLDEAAKTALRQARFRPAIGSDDRPLQYSIRYRYTFRLEG